MAADEGPVLVWLLVHRQANGDAPLTVRVAAPVYLEDPFPGWRCRFQVEGYLGRETTLVGATALQALGLALRVLRDVLRTAAAEGALIEARTGQQLDADMLADSLH